VIDEVVKPAAAPELRAYVIWLPILPGDSAAAAAQAAARCGEPRASYYWDPDRALGEELGKALALPPRETGRISGMAWDVYLLFERDARWNAAPAFWMQQLDDVPATTAPRLNTAALRARLNELLAKAAQ
jgi:hypothetical protein